MYFASLSTPANTHQPQLETTRRNTATDAPQRLRKGGNSFNDLRFRRLKYFYESDFAYENKSF
jgi:hypothetical protein